MNRYILAIVLAVAGTVAAAPTGQAVDNQQLVTVRTDQDGMHVCPSNLLATVGQTAALEARLEALEVSAAAESNAYVRATEVVNDVAEMIANQEVVVLQDGFAYSLGETASVSTNCVCQIATYKHNQVHDRDGYFGDRVVFGFNEDIGSLNPIAEFRDSLGANSLDWTSIECTTPTPTSLTFERDGVTFAYCYEMTIYVPNTYATGFFRIYTQISAQTGDGSRLDLVGGIQGGITFTDTDGLIYRGGLCMGTNLVEAAEAVTLSAEEVQ
ncbi:MAG: hypothetical protein ACI4Q3_00645 [Kiritimatiellia bacterium]